MVVVGGWLVVCLCLNERVSPREREKREERESQ
jgi:hypothetical protein